MRERHARDAATAADLLTALVATPEGCALLRQVIEASGVQFTATAPEAVVYTVAQVAEQIGKHPRTVRNQINAGALKASKRCGEWVILADDLKAWAASGRPSTTMLRAPRKSTRATGDGLAALNARIRRAT